jgi:hypothetical protein
LDEERLIDGFVAYAHRLVIRKVDDEAPGDLLRAPCFGPSSILSLAMSASVPGNCRTWNGNAVRGRDHPGEPFLDIGAQSRILRKLRNFRTPA